MHVMYIEKKKIGQSIYNYLKISVRVGDKVRTKTLAYLGKEPMSKKEIDESIAKIPLSRLDEARAELMASEDVNSQFLTKEQIFSLSKIKKEFTGKLNQLDQKLISDMFKDFKTAYIYNTNSIEGNTLTLEETNLLLNENITPKSKDLREVYDHINERDTFDYLLKEMPDISTESILDIHARLLNNIDERRGQFRRHNVRVFGADFETSDAKYVLIDVGLLLRWYNKNKRRIHPLILAALFHEKFERIHPFYDGNGRTGRMLMNLILIKNKYPPLIIKNKNRKEYYRVLSIGHKALLTKTEPEFYKAIVDFCYAQLNDTYNKIFSKWG